MPISGTQLETWSHQGATTSSAKTYAAVRAAIDASPLKANHSVDVYLQGSYANHTNIYGESDVDVVVHCDETFWWDVDLLPEPSRTQQANYLRSLGPAKYKFAQFRADVEQALVNYFGAGAVTNNNKCLEVQGAGGTSLSADVVPCFNHRLHFVDSSGQVQYIEGMAFLTQHDQPQRRVENYPKQHIANGSAKNDATSQRFKPMVRVFKNIKARLVEKGYISEDLAPSYFIECLLYNVGDQSFIGGDDWQERFKYAYGGIDEAKFGSYTCVNRVIPLFGSTPEQWTVTRASDFMNQILRLWNE